MHLAIQARDAIATAIAGAVTTVRTSKAYNYKASELPACNVRLGDCEIDEQMGRQQHHEQNIIMMFTVIGGDDPESDLINVVRNALHLLAADPKLGGVVHDSMPVSTDEPDIQEGSEKIAFTEVTYMCKFAVDHDDLNTLI
jgi:hypothetical protein